MAPFERLPAVAPAHGNARACGASAHSMCGMYHVDSIPALSAAFYLLLTLPHGAASAPRFHLIWTTLSPHRARCGSVLAQIKPENRPQWALFSPWRRAAPPASAREPGAGGRCGVAGSRSMHPLGPSARQTHRAPPRKPTARQIPSKSAPAPAAQVLLQKIFLAGARCFEGLQPSYRTPPSRGYTQK